MTKKKEEEVQEPSFDSMIEGGTEGGNGVEQDLNAGAGTVLANFEANPDFDQDDVVIPRLRLAQGLTTEVQDGLARPGQWILTGFEPEDELTIVPLAFKKRRELRDDDTREVLCLSQDSRTGAGEPGGDCSVCSLAEWADGDDGKRIPPPCNFMYSYLVYISDLDAMAMLSFAKTGLTSGKLLNTIVAQRGMGRCAVRLANSQRKGPHGNYYVPAVNPTNVDDGVLKAAQEKVAGGVVV